MMAAMVFWIAAALALVQQPPAPPAFEVASVKLAPPRTGEARYLKMSTDQGRIAFSNVNLRFLISYAYEIGDTRILGLSDWMESTPYDIAATIPTGTPKEQIPAMCRTLLGERFALSVQWTTKTMSVYGLAVAKRGSKLKQAQPEEARGNSIFAGRVVGPDMSMGALAEVLSRITDRPVLDKTGLKGMFDVNLEWTPDNAKANLSESGNGASIYTAVREQLGLELVSEKAPVPFLMIEHANRTPLEN